MSSNLEKLVLIISLISILILPYSFISSNLASASASTTTTTSEEDADWKCKAENFYRPYVELRKTRVGSPVLSLGEGESQFLDLRNHYGYLLCINGPAYLYADLLQLHNMTSQPGQQLITYFVNPSFKFYQHECFPINRPKNITYHLPRKLGQQGAKKTSTTAETDEEAAARMIRHRMMKIPLGPMDTHFEVVESTRRVFGVTLLGGGSGSSSSSSFHDYRKPFLYMFSGDKFSQNVNELMISSSFAAGGGPSEWKCLDEFTNTSLFVKSMGKSEQICTQSEEVPPTSFDSVFKRAHFKQEYRNCWERVPFDKELAPGGGGGDGSAEGGSATKAPPVSPPLIVPPPRKTGPSMEAIGRIIDPAHFGRHAQSSNSNSGGHVKGPLFPGGAGGNGTGTGTTPFKYPFDFPEDYDPRTVKPWSTQVLELKECETAPELQIGCQELKKGLSNNGSTSLEGGCGFLHAILELDTEPVFDSPVVIRSQVGSASASSKMAASDDTSTRSPDVAGAGAEAEQTSPEPRRASAGTGTPTGTSPPNSWKVSIISLLEQIFHKICPAIDLQSLQSVSRVMGSYLAELQLGDTSSKKGKRDFWDIASFELEHCRNESKAMEFKKVLNFGSLEHEAYIKGTTLRRLPIRKIATQAYVKKVDGNFAEIFYYEEAAEVDYEFNVVIDSQWKIFASVLGYCNKYNTIKMSSTFQRLYLMFYEDFLQPLQDKWIDASSNNLFGNLIGDLVYGDNRLWLDFCLEGSYLHSSSEQFRAIRPVPINLLNYDGSQRTANGSTTPVAGDLNYFVTAPMYFG